MLLHPSGGNSVNEGERRETLNTKLPSVALQAYNFLGTLRAKIVIMVWEFGVSWTGRVLDSLKSLAYLG